jgi:PAS domain S-box-containing protein
MSSKFLKLEILGLLVISTSIIGLFNTTLERVELRKLNAELAQANQHLRYFSTKIEATMHRINQQAFGLVESREWAIPEVKDDFSLVRAVSDFFNTYDQVEKVEVHFPDSYLLFQLKEEDNSLIIKHETSEKSNLNQTAPTRGIFRGTRIQSAEPERRDWSRLIKNAAVPTLSLYEGDGRISFNREIINPNGNAIAYQLTLNLKKHIASIDDSKHLLGFRVQVEDEPVYAYSSISPEKSNVAYSALAGWLYQGNHYPSEQIASLKTQFNNLNMAYIGQYALSHITTIDIIESQEFIFLILGSLGLLLLYALFKTRIRQMKTEGQINAQSLALANAKLGIILNQPDSFLYQTDHKGNLTDISSNVKFVLGYSPSEMIGKPIEAYFQLKTIPTVNQERKDECVEMSTAFEDTVVVELNEKFHVRDSKEVEGKFGFARNITKEVTAEKENNFEQKNRGALLDAIPDAIITLDFDGKLMDWKSPSSYIFPFEFNPETGADIRDIFPAGIASEIQLAFNLAGKVENFQQREVSFSNEHKTWYFEMRAIRLSSDHIMVLIREITSQKLLELELEKGKIDAERSSLAKDQFISIISHELKTPLNGILGMSHLLEDTSLSIEQRNYLKTLQDSAKNLNNIITDILDFSKIANGEVEVIKTEFELAELVDYVCKSHYSFAEGKGLKFVYSVLLEESAKIQQDFGKLAQILSQVVHNAIKFTDKGSVHLLVNKNEDDLVFKISDTGIGMAENRLEELFKPFTQIDDSDSRKHGGIGIGLALTTRLVNILGGTIEASSTPGKGTIFTIKVPLFSEKRPIKWSVESKRAKAFFVIDSNPITRGIIYNKLDKAGFSILKEFNDWQNTSHHPDFILVNKNSNLTQEQLECIEYYKDYPGVKTIAFKLENKQLKEITLPLEPDAEILLDATASNLKDQIHNLQP